MLSIILALVILYGWHTYLYKKPKSALCVICAQAALYNVPLQDILPGTPGFGVSLAIALFITLGLLIFGGIKK